MFEQYFLAIHLNKFKTIQEFENLLKDNNIKTTTAKYLQKIKEDGYTKVFIDKNTHELVAFCHTSIKGEVKFTVEYVQFLKNLKSIDIKKEKTELDLDKILDKIIKGGLDSLTFQEKEFLENQK